MNRSYRTVSGLLALAAWASLPLSGPPEAAELRTIGLRERWITGALESSADQA